MSKAPEAALTLDDHQQAFTEVSFLLDIFAATIDSLMGGATVSVGRIAGRQMARNLPLYLPNPQLPDVLAALAEHMRAGFEISFHCTGATAELTFGHCVIRDVCHTRNLPLGGELCRLFHHYTDGLVNELCLRPAKSALESGSDTCRAQLEIR